MEFSFNINNLIANDISLIDRNLTPHCSTYETARQRKDELRKIIDDMGIASAKAQGLHGPITSASRLSQSSHHLYIKKDSEANNGNGAVVGFIKVGKKKLFVYDGNGIQHEREPLCVLDFYVCESCQRRGSGKRLFDAMLQRENVLAVELAIDRPSSKCLSFLLRHYDLHSPIPQVNNFVVFNGFFRDRFGARLGRRSNQAENSASAHQRQGSFSSPNQTNHEKTQSSVSRDVPYGVDQARDLPLHQPNVGRGHASGAELNMFHAESSQSAGFRPPSNRESRPPSGVSLNRLPTLGMGAHQAMYSRHQVPSPLVTDDGNTVVGTIATYTDSKPTRNRVDSPPLLQRGGPPPDYLKLTGNTGYLDRRGHLRVGPLNPSFPATTNFYDPTNSSAIQRMQQDTTFNIFGVPKLPLRSVSSNQVPYRKTALW